MPYIPAAVLLHAMKASEFQSREFLNMSLVNKEWKEVVSPFHSRKALYDRFLSPYMVLNVDACADLDWCALYQAVCKVEAAVKSNQPPHASVLDDFTTLKFFENESKPKHPVATLEWMMSLLDYFRTLGGEYVLHMWPMNMTYTYLNTLFQRPEGRAVFQMDDNLWISLLKRMSERAIADLAKVANNSTASVMARSTIQKIETFLRDHIYL